MTNSGSVTIYQDELSRLLTETRKALSNLRADELERLVGRAQTIVDLHPVVMMRGIFGTETSVSAPAIFKRQHLLLGELLHATRRNIEVVQRLSGVQCERTHTINERVRWEL